MANSQSKSCDGKVRYANELAADYHISNSNKSGSEYHYLCEYCEGFHTATVPGMKVLSNKRSIAFAEKRDKKPLPKFKYVRRENRHKKR